MKMYYEKIIDRMIPPKMERRFHLGRRFQGDRRLKEKDRRLDADDLVLYYQSERRSREDDRRSDDLDERRQRWFRINRWQSRHF
jgi:hypothetical protein